MTDLGSAPELQLITVDKKRTLELSDAIVGAPELELTIDGASTLTVQCADHARRLLGSDALTTRSWATVAGINFELVATGKAGDMVTLTFEDAIAAALRRRKKTLRIPPNTSTRAQIFARLAREAHVKTRIDPTKRPKVHNQVERVGGDSSWDLSGTLATDIGWRRFSNGRRLIVGSDDWLLERDTKPTRIREHTGPWGAVDFDLDTGKRASAATVSVDAEFGVLRPGDVVKVMDDWPALAGNWLVGTYRLRLGSTRGELTLTRRQPPLKEPKGTGGKESAPDKGEQDFLPDQDGSTAGTSSSNTAREKMVGFALSRQGDAYVWGGSGPSSWDCSGLVEGATAYAGNRLAGASATQWGICQAQGKAIAVSTGLSTRGALLFRMGSPYNHVAISLGNGSTIEAMGTAYGVLVAGNAATRGWTGSALWI